MRNAPVKKCLPGIERLEAKQLLSAAPAWRPGQATRFRLPRRPTLRRQAQQNTVSPDGKKPGFGYLLFRITNPNTYNKTLRPPFNQVLVQTQQPVPGQVYNILFVVGEEWHGTNLQCEQWFLCEDPSISCDLPILTGNEQWKSGQQIVFYIMTKKYYPLPSTRFMTDSSSTWPARGRSEFRDHRESISGSNTILPHSPTRSIISSALVKAQGGGGVRFGMPRHFINEFLPRKPTGTISPATSSSTLGEHPGH